jgi:hypothetical protein
MAFNNYLNEKTIMNNWMNEMISTKNAHLSKRNGHHSVLFLPTISLYMVSVTQGQLWSESIKWKHAEIKPKF